MSVKILAKNDESLKSVLHDTALFKNLSEEEIQRCLACSKAESIYYEKGEMVFSEEDHPACLPMMFSVMSLFSSERANTGCMRRRRQSHIYL